MHEELHPFLNAYLDNELHGVRLQKMQAHLETCDICRNELEELRQLSALLQSAPAPEFQSADQFAVSLALTLPERKKGDQLSKASSLILWMIPMGLLFDWFIVQMVILVRDALFVAGTAGVFGPANSAVNSGSSQPLWFAVLNLLTGGRAAGSAVVNQVNTINGISSGFWSGFMWQLGIDVAYLAWLAFWWFKRRPQAINVTASHAKL